MEETIFHTHCDECGKGMNEGYVIDGGTSYYCTDKCLHKHISKEDYLEMYDEGNSDTYYTEWETD